MSSWFGWFLFWITSLRLALARGGAVVADWCCEWKGLGVAEKPARDGHDLRLLSGGRVHLPGAGFALETRLQHCCASPSDSDESVVFRADTPVTLRAQNPGRSPG